MIEVSGLTVSFGRAVVVDDVSFDVPSGGSLALWGTNGAGKTSALRAMLGLLPFRGTVRVGGHDVRRDGRSARSLVGYVPQQLAFWDDLGALECLRFLARLRRAPVDQAATLLAQVELADHAGKRIRSLSGGMRQRLALAAALLGDPPILLLDEPTANLDAAGRSGFLALLAGLREAGKTLVVTSHRLNEVQVLAERVLVLESGRATLACPAAEFEAALYPQATLRLVVAAQDEVAAMAELRRGGFEAVWNHRGILVRVATAHRAKPVALLFAASVAVEDFSLEDGGWTDT